MSLHVVFVIRTHFEDAFPLISDQLMAAYEMRTFRLVCCCSLNITALRVRTISWCPTCMTLVSSHLLSMFFMRLLSSSQDNTCA